MGDQQKKRRLQCLKNFTRSVNNFTSLLQDSAPTDMVTTTYQKVQSCWEKLETAQDAYIEAVDIDATTHPDGIDYLDEPADRHQKVLTEYSAFLKKAMEDEQVFQKTQADDNVRSEDSRREKELEAAMTVESAKVQEEKENKFESTTAEFQLVVDAFVRRNDDVQNLVGEASDGDKRRELEKLEDDFEMLRKKLVELGGIDSSKDTDQYKNTFIESVEKPFSVTQKWFMSELRNSALPVVTVSTSSSSNRDYSTKKEAVHLPSFQGDEKCSPFLKYPVWRKQWDSLISEYDERWRCNLLNEHLDETARGKFVGYETDYDGALTRLDSFYGNPLKVVDCVLKEVMSPSVIREHDYQRLISYCIVLENNFNRLKSINLEHEMSNTSTMSMILRKFPNTVGEKWAEYILIQNNAIKAKPFPAFVDWLISQKQIWERVAAVEGSKEGMRSVTSFYSGDVPSGSALKCFQCGEEGHKKRFCPRRSNKNNANEGRSRNLPKVKKHWCALHRDDTSKRCSSVSCQELRKTEANRRIQLLKENGDCAHCCGDHKSTDCNRKERVCGGGREDRGCSKTHATHELFCPAAKVFYSVQQVHSVDTHNDAQAEGVVLLIMNVQSSRKGESATVFWDLGSSSNFVREAFAKSMNFTGKQERLCVTTLTGVVTDYTVITYKCSLRDENNELHDFEAYGLESITGSLTKIDSHRVKTLFPNLSDKVIQAFKRSSNVDYMIGMKHPSWHPERAERTIGGGDLWLYRGKFGLCVGGRHPDIKEETRRSNNLFSVNFTYHTTVTIDERPHALEFCLDRVSPYIHKSGFCERSWLGRSVCNPLNSVERESCETISNPVEPNVLIESTEDVSVLYVCAPSTNEAIEQHDSTSIPSSSSCVPIDSCDVTENVVVTNTETLNDTVQCHVTKTSVLTKEDLFFQSEALGTIVEPSCGSCKCSKCPVPGSKYSFKEQKEFDIVQKNLKYNSYDRRWYTVYPWLCPRSTLPKNDRIAYQSLVTLERSLSRDPELAEDFCNQIEDMISRGAAVVLTEEQVSLWSGDYYYLPLVGVKGKKKWLRLCFDASRRQGGYPSMNDCLHKGPDRFLNNLLSVLLCFRNGRVGCAADISKFHNQVYLEEPDVHMQRFLWRGMDTTQQPSTYAVKVNNFGVKPANCIATSALHQSADHFTDIYPEESRELKTQTYIDDELVAAADKPQALVKTARLDEICEHAGMPNKGWTFSGDDKGDVALGGEVSEEKVLGISWFPKSDTFKFHVSLSFKAKGSSEVHVSTLEDLQNLPPSLLTRRSLLSNIHRIFDPMGLLIPVLLESKLLMRESWIDKDIGWDDPLPPELRKRWFTFLCSLLSLGEVEFSRSLWPDEEVIGLPILVIFSDGAALAFGVAAYIRWTLASGGYWSRLIVAKGKIGPKKIISVPRMELNGALLGNRVKNFILNDTNLCFGKVYQLVDSSTVLGYIHKDCGIFHPFEGIRIAEIHSSNHFLDEKLEGWAWVSGDLNPADWCTKPRSARKISQDRFWEDGPDFLRQDEDSWPIKFTYKTGRLEGEVTIGKKQVVFFQSCFPDILGRLIVRVGVWTRLIRVLCWILRLATSGGVKANTLSAEELQRAKTILIKYTQKDLVVDLALASEKGVGRFRKLAPICDADGVWRVGSRLKNFVPFTDDQKMPVIIPPDHRVTLLVMRKAHLFSHAGLDGTLSRFHSEGYWTVRAGHLAKTVKNQCVPCRKVSGVTQSQAMGDIPDERLKNRMAWGYCQMDLFGPFSCRGDVNPRTTKKTWGVVIEDMNSGAVHLDIVQDYSSNAVLTSMRRFGSLRGWPCVVYSDPGSQLVSASGKLVTWWNEIQDPLMTFAGSKNFKWEISPADSPWRQGKAERRISVVKRLIKLSVGDSRLTPVELQTSLMEIAYLCNERPIGLSKPRDDGTYSILTPNQLLTGRSGNILPDDTPIVENLPMAARYRVVSHVSTSFWQKWCVLVGPTLVVRQKWHQKSRNIRVDDLVMIADSGKIKGKYKLGIVVATNLSEDGLVRSATVRYFIRRDVSKTWTAEQVTRSVQRLSLILAVEEQETPMMVKDGDVNIQVCTDRS